MSNPHITAALELLDPEGDFLWESGDLANISARLEAQAQATLALAYEQRTANLLASLEMSLRAQGQLNIDRDQLVTQINTRLGLGDTK